MDLEEMAMRLNSLEQARNDDLQKAAQQAFMNKYGSRISNNDSLGLVILNELNRRGVDVSAADEAVTSILDQLRMEATALLDTIKDNMQQASDLIDKVDDMQQAVESASMAVDADTSVPSAEMEAGTGAPVEPFDPTTVSPAPEGDEVSPAPEGGEVSPAPEGGEASPAPEGGEVSPAPEGGEVSPAPEGGEMPPVGDVVSDKRMKMLKHRKSVISDKRMKNVHKLDSDIIAACSRSF